MAEHPDQQRSVPQFTTIRQVDGRFICQSAEIPGVWGGGLTEAQAHDEARLVYDDYVLAFGRPSSVPDDTQVERGARAVYAWASEGATDYDTMPEDERQQCRDCARNVLAAALRGTS